MKNLVKFSLMVLVTLVTATSFAKVDPNMDIDDARAQKLVSEEPTGYIKALKEEAKEYAEVINSKRRKAYEEIAKKSNTTPEVVGQRAHEQIKAKLKGQ